MIGGKHDETDTDDSNLISDISDEICSPII